jgi:carboxypeptidase family protein
MRASRFLIGAFIAVMSAPMAFTQTRSALTGTVTDSTSAVLPQAQVTLQSPELIGGAQVTTTDGRGEYRFSDLPPGVYLVTAELRGFQAIRRTGLRLLSSTTLTVDITLRPGAVEQAIDVVGSAPAIDVTTAQAPSTIDQDLLMKLPIITDQRNSFEAFALSPAINGRAAYGGGRDANELLLDGTPLTIPQRQGINPAKTLSTNWLEEIQVAGLGANAEYGDFSGTVANFIVRSGSNDFHGLVEYRLNPKWESDNTGSLPQNLRQGFNSLDVLSEWDATAQIGGPLVKDKLFFFTGFTYVRNRSQNAGAPLVADDRFPRFVTKVDWAARPSFKVQGTFNMGKETLSGVSGAGMSAETSTRNVLRTPVWTVRAHWTRPKTLIELRTGGLDYAQDIVPEAPRTIEGPPSHDDTVTGIRSGNTQTYFLNSAQRMNVAGNVTRYLDTGSGQRHVIKAGLEFEHFRFRQATGAPGGMRFTDRAGVPSTVLFWAGDTTIGTGNRVNFYVQDQWRIGAGITFEPGVRVALLRGSTPTTGEVFSTNPVSPRLGLAWDLAQDHRTVVRAHWGRFHEFFGTGLFEFMDTDGRTPQITAQVLPNGTFRETSRFTPAGNVSIDPDLSHAYMDQVLVGVEREVIRDLSIKAQYIQRDHRDIFGYVDPTSIYQAVQVPDPGPDGRAGTADDAGTITVFDLRNPGATSYVFTNPEGASRRYRAFQLIAQKRYAHRWQLLAAYTRSRARGTVDNGGSQNAGGAPAASPFANPNAATNSTGRNTLDFPHEVVVRATYDAPVLGGLAIGGSYHYLSGGAWSRLVRVRLTQGNVDVRVTPRGTEPSPALSQFDLRFSKDIPLRNAVKASLYLDIFNLTNRGVVDRVRYQEASGATFGQPLTWIDPRTFKLAARLAF